MRICLVSSSFYPATFYGGPISATWGLSKKLTDQNIEVFVSTTNANGNKKLDVLIILTSFLYNWYFVSSRFIIFLPKFDPRAK